jgi:hypothetical protein
VQTQLQEEAERARDLAVGILSSAEDTPISALGINNNAHFAVNNVAQWNAIGDNLVDNQTWDGILPASGMRSVVFWTGRPDNYAGRVQIQIEPSFMVQPGIFVAYNDHYDLTRVTSQPQTRREVQKLARPDDTESTVEKVAVAMEVLTSNWQASMDRLRAITQRIWERGKTGS